MSTIYSYTDMDMRSKTSRHHMVVDPDESEDEAYDAWYDEHDDEELDYESDFDKDEPEPQPQVPSSWEDNVGMVTLGRKSPSRGGQSPSPTPVQLASKSSPWKTLDAQRVSLRAVQDKIDTDRKVKEQQERVEALKRQRDHEAALERQWKQEQQELKAAAELKARAEREEAAAKAKAKEAAARAKAKKLEVEAELKRRQDEEAAVKEARAERRKARSYEREHELQMNRAQMRMSPIKLTVAPLMPMPKSKGAEPKSKGAEPKKETETEAETDTESESDSEDHAEMLALMQHKAQPVTSKSTRLEEERRAERKARVEAQRKAREEVWTKVEGKAKKPLVIKMGQASYRYVSPVPTMGSAPFGLGSGSVRVVEPEKVVDRLTKTRMCISVEKGIKCPHGDNCRFAHNVDELQIPQCMFGCDCRFVSQRGGGQFLNSSDKKVCKFIHTGESKESFYSRTGIKAPAPVKGPPKTPPVKPKATLRAPPKAPVKAPPPKGWATPPKITATPPEVFCKPCDETSSVSSSTSRSSTSRSSVSQTGQRRVCKYVMEGKACPHKKCRFSHDLPKADSLQLGPDDTPLSGSGAMTMKAACAIDAEVDAQMALNRAKVDIVPPLRPSHPSQLPTDTATTPFMPVIPTVQTIYVPESQYMMALQMAMNSGKNLRIEIAR